MAVEDSADLLTQLKEEVGFDVSSSGSSSDLVLLGWLNARHRRMVARSKCYRSRLTMPPGTVVGQADYVLPPEIIEIHSVEVGGVRFDRASRSGVIDARNATAVFTSQGGEGVVAQGANGSSAETLTIFPTPTTADLEIAVFGPVRAPELRVEGISEGIGITNSPVVPPEFFDALVNGAAAIGLKRTESRHGEGQSYDQEFDSACEELRRQTRARWGGRTRVQIEWP